MGKTAKTQEKTKLNKNIETVEKRQTREDLIKSQRERVNKHSELEKMKRRKEERKYSRDEYKTPIKQVLVATTHEDKQEFREDILKGIIFSEILGKPKSLKK